MLGAQDQCPSQYGAFLYTSWSGVSYLLDPQYGFMINIPSNWDSSIQSNGYTFIPCENPEVGFDLQVFNLPDGVSTEQIAEQFVNGYIQNIEGYHVITSEFIDGTTEYSVLASIGESESPTIWHAFIPITNTGMIYVTTLTTSSSDLYEKYSGVARAIYDSLATVTQSQANDLIQLAISHNEFMTQGFANAVEIGNQGMQNTLEIWQQKSRIRPKVSRRFRTVPTRRRSWDLDLEPLLQNSKQIRKHILFCIDQDQDAPYP